VEGGWNQVGPFEAEIGPGAVKQNPSGIIEAGTWFRWDPAQSQYVKPSVLKPGFGYWVFATGSGTLDFAGGGAEASTATASTTRAASPQPKDASSVRERPEGALTLQVTDEAGRRAKVYLTEELTEEQRRRWRVPPIGPGNTFAVRFASGLRVAEDSFSEAKSEEGGEGRFSDGALLRVRGAEGPVTLRLQAPERQSSRKDRAGQAVRVVDAATGGELLEARLTGESPSAEVPAGAQRLRLSVEQRPAEAALQEPYPNPARGQATLEYGVPKQTDVIVKVYDVLGREVATLVDDKKRAGTYRASLDASRLSSGTYFVRMRAGRFQETRRVAVVK